MTAGSTVIDDKALTIIIPAISTPNSRRGTRLENAKTPNPMATDRALKRIALPVVSKVVRRADGSILTANVEYEDLRSLTELLEGDNVQIPMMKLKSMIEGHYLKDNLVRQNNSK